MISLKAYDNQQLKNKFYYCLNNRYFKIILKGLIMQHSKKNASVQLFLTGVKVVFKIVKKTWMVFSFLFLKKHTQTLQHRNAELFWKEVSYTTSETGIQ